MAQLKTEVAEKQNFAPLVVAEASTVGKDLMLVKPQEIKAAPEEDPALAKQAEGFVKTLLATDTKNITARKEKSEAVESLGREIQRSAASESRLLKEPVRKLAKAGDDGGPLAKDLISLKMKVEDLDPGKFDFEPGWISRTLGKLPFVGTPVKRFFTQYESAQTVIGAIIRALEIGREELKRDNITLGEDQKRMRETTLKLEKTVKLALLIDKKIEKEMAAFSQDEERTKFIQEEIIFPLRQRILDLQQQLAVNQQGVLASELIIRNNKELARGVNRVLDVTVSALEIGVAVAMALANQKIVLEKVDAVTKTTSDIISGTAARLKTQGAAIQKQASTAMLDIDALKSAFADINAAFADITSFRRTALPKMAEQILTMDRLTEEAEKEIGKMEKGNAAQPAHRLEVI
jgi:uncharacterized protein YaaN involved in tellurite resistance